MMDDPSTRPAPGFVCADFFVFANEEFLLRRGAGLFPEHEDQSQQTYRSQECESGEAAAHVLAVTPRFLGLDALSKASVKVVFPATRLTGVPFPEWSSDIRFGGSCREQAREQRFPGGAGIIAYLTGYWENPYRSKDIEIFNISLALAPGGVPNLRATMHYHLLVVVARLRGSIPMPLSCQVAGHKFRR